MKCNLCGSTEFKDVNSRKNVLCARCGSYERTRLMQLYLAQHSIQRDMRVLHFAPETGLYRWLRPLLDDYVVADYDLARYSHIPEIQFVDLSDPSSYERFGEFDLILHSHVIEHIYYNYSALLLRLHRMLRPNGVHSFSIPIYGPHYSEHWGAMSNDEATSRFGQFDHIRRFSPKDLDKTIGALFNLEPQNLPQKFGEDVLREANIPEDIWSSYNGSTVFWLTNHDCKL